MLELFMIAVGVAMDAFAVAICKGLSMTKMSWKNAFITGFYFGSFQALMPLFGYLLGSHLHNNILSYEHWISFFLLTSIGINMIKNAKEKIDSIDNSFKFYTMLLLAIATSIDALAVGVTFAFLDFNLLFSICFIGTLTFSLSVIGVKIGNMFGVKYKSKAEQMGGIILILIALKILIEYLFSSYF